MNWEQLLSSKRYGMENYHVMRDDDRSEFQRDYDRLIFSAPFRRMQNKTQVFPLPGSVFVHNRLTHSLEVACVGRSLGNGVAKALLKQGNDVPFNNDIGAIVAAACLAHDMGNPPFGHSGEKAIATFFSEGNGQKYRDVLSPAEWADITLFDGNANTFRLLTHQFNGRRMGGFALTYSTLAAIVKYPYAAIDADPKKQKFGFFVSDADAYAAISSDLGIARDAQFTERFVRHPLVFLVEAADDICYQIMDIEDAHKLKILSTHETIEMLLGFFDDERQLRRRDVLKLVEDVNEQIAYLRSSVIGLLIDECCKVFVQHENEILAGTYNTALIKNISPTARNAYNNCSKMAVARIYRSQDVLDVELAGYKIILTLLDHFVAAVFSPDKAYSKQLLNRIPSQYETDAPTPYGKLIAILDFISGMTDVYALDLYRKITGMSIPHL